jgi:lysophospholipase L1-like esterase
MNKKIKLLAIGVLIIVASTIGIPQIMNVQYKPINVIRVACVGDSITEGSEYPSDLQWLLGAYYSVCNFGARGSTVSLSSQEPYMDQTAFQKAKEFQPNIVVIMLGTNDAHSDVQQYNESFENDYKKLVVSFQELESKPQILVVKPPQIFNSSGNLSPTYFSENLIPHIENLANELNLPIIDVYTALGNHLDYYTDGVHPNSEGSALIAFKVYDAIISQESSQLIL